MNILWLLPLLGALGAAFIAFAGVSAAKGAPQEAAIAGIALCVAIIPYVFVRALEGMFTADWRKKMLKEAEKANQPKPAP